MTLAVSILVFLSSCKKDEINSPMVLINKPLPGQHFSVGDTVAVAASISDDHQITSVTVRLQNSDFISVGTDVTTTIGSRVSDFQIHYVLDNQNLATGNYYFAVMASNGVKVTTAFVSIHINESPRIRKGVYFFSSANNFSFKISKLDSLRQPNPVINVNGDFGTSAIYSGNHELYTVGRFSGDLNAFNLEDNSLLWYKPSASSSVPTFQNLCLSGDEVFVSYYDGYIKGFNKSGLQQYEVQQQGYFIPDVILKTDQYFFAELYYTGSHQSKIGVFYNATGAERQERTIDIDLKKMYAPDAGHLILFGNDTTFQQGKIELYNLAGNGSTAMHTLPAGIIYDAVQINNSNYLVTCSAGIYLYDYSVNGLTPFVPGLPFYSLEYDDLNGEVFACSGNTIHVYDFTTASEKYIIVDPDSVMAVKFRYNR